MRGTRAFTLVELLVVFAVVAALTAVVIPVLSSARQAARDTHELSNLRQIYVDFTNWSTSHRGVIANAGSPMEKTAEAVEYYGLAHEEDRGWGLYLLQGELWPLLVRMQYDGEIPGHWHSSYEDENSTLGNPNAVYAAENEDLSRSWDYAMRTEYRLGATLLTEAQIWSNPGAVVKQRWVRNHARKVRFADVVAPSRKGLMFLHHWPGASKGLHHVLFCDGAASVKDFAEARPTSVPPFESSGEPGMAVDATFNGYKGVDF